MKKLNPVMLSILLLQSFITSSESIASFLVADEERIVAGLTEVYRERIEEGYKLRFTIAPETADQNKVRIQALSNLKTIRQGGVFEASIDRELIFTKKNAHIFLSAFKGKTGVEIKGLNLLGF